MQRIWGWSHLEKCFFFWPNELTNKGHACMRESWETFHWSFTNLELLFVISVHFSLGVLKTGLAKISTHSVTWDRALYFRFTLKITFRRARRNEKRAWYKTSTKRLPPTFWLIDICRIRQPKLLPLLVFLVCKFSIHGKNADSLPWKIAFIF